MADKLEGRRILLVAPRFFGYEKEIASHLRDRGAVVDWLPDRPYSGAGGAALTKVAPGLVSRSADRLYRAMLQEFNAPHYDYVLVINGQTLSSRILRELRQSYPRAEFILYMWDSLENRGHVADNFGFYDKLFSFDPLSVQQYNMVLRPLFYIKREPRIRHSREDFLYDISFVGTAHSDRYAVISKLKENLPAHTRSRFYLYLQARWIYLAYRLSKRGMKTARADDFEYAPMSKADFLETMQQSLSVMDIEHPLQRGLTMRTFEVMGVSQKLVTTNAQIVDYEFYRPGNICVVDRENPVIPADFFETPYEELPESMLERYSIRGWIDEMLGVGDQTPAA